jgi:hypothetical protein
MDKDLEIIHTPGAPGDAGFAHGRAVYDIFEPGFVDAYLNRLGEAIGFDVSDLARQASVWMDRLPDHFQDEIVGMAHGAGVPVATVCEVLFADIATPTRTAVDARATPATDAIVSGGPMCSALIARLDNNAGDGRPWLGRNCDWLTPTLMRGTAGVVHRAPNRIPAIGVGIRGDIDIDTGMNAEGLWLHLHTIHAADPVPDDRPVISWLFWAREALETCATIDEVGAFVGHTGRDKGVLAICLEGKTGDAAVFECGRGTSVRHDFDAASMNEAVCLTNHSPAKHIDDGTPWRGLPSGTIGRQRALRKHARNGSIEEGPGDLVRALAADGVEMRTPRWLRTIYACVVEPRSRGLWFAAGTTDGSPAASGDGWSRVRWDW